MNAIEQREIYAKSNFEIMSELGARFRAYRIALGLSQKEVAEQCGTTNMTVSRFECGKAGSIRLSTFLGLLRALKLLENVYATIPNLPESPSEIYERRNKQRRRAPRK